MVTIQREAVKRERRGGGPVWAQSRLSHVLPVGPVKIRLLWVQGMWDVSCKQSGEGWQPWSQRVCRGGESGRPGPFSRVTRCICGIQPVGGGGDVGREL